MLSNEHLIVICAVLVFFLVLVFNEHITYWVLRKFSRTQKEKGEEEGNGNEFRCYHFLPWILNQGSQFTIEKADAVRRINITIRNVLMSSGWMTPSNTWHGLLETDKRSMCGRAIFSRESTPYSRGHSCRPGLYRWMLPTLLHKKLW